MIKEGILSKGARKEKNWEHTAFRIPYSKAVERFRNEVMRRADFDPSTLLIWGTYMAATVLQMTKDIEENFGPRGQNVIIESMRKVGYDIAEQMFEGAVFPEGATDIEKISFATTWVNTVAWTSIEDPKIVGKDEAIFDILWCPHQDTYKAFDCRVQRYLVEGILRYLRRRIDPSFDLEFKWTIPAGAKTCRFRIWKRDDSEKGQWEEYSQSLARKALSRRNRKMNGIRRGNRGR